MFKSARVCVAAAAMSLVLLGCGGAGNIGTGTGTDTGGGGGGGTPINPLYRIGTLNGTTFTEGAVAIGNTPLSAGGQTAVSVDIVDSTGQRVNAVSAVVSFSSDCAATQQSSFNPVTVTTTQGNAASTYVASGCSGTDVVRASALVNGSTTAITAQGSLSVASAALGSISFVSATPMFVGMIGSPYSNQSTLVYRVTNVNGGPVSNTKVTFTPSNAVGGLFVSPIENTTDANGLVRTTLNAGSAQTVVRVRASAQVSSGQELTTQSEQLIISTGIPDDDSFSLSVEKLSLNGSCDGESSEIVVRLADRYNNPVPAGTAISFTAEGGKINSGCTTSDPTTDPLAETGVCKVLFTVQNPRPPNGRVSILASALGEESFTDQNSNGFFDAGDTIKDILEPFMDNNESGVYDSGEFFRDANGNSAFDTALNGTFEGYRCDSPGRNCRSVTTPIGQNVVIALSETDVGVPVATNLQGNAATYAPSASDNFTVTVSDANGNSLPTGTTYTLTLTNGTVLAPATTGPFNTSNGNNLRYGFTVGAATAVGAPDERAMLTANIPASGDCRSAQSIVLDDLFTYRVQ